MLANRRKERAQRKGTTCSVQCPKCQLLFLSEVSLKHHLSQERLQAICNQACELREILFTFDAQEIVLKTMTQKEKLILNVHIIQLFSNN